ncbi:MAG: formylmethanofuran dehydrogenase subunit B [Methanothrix sp.]|nr:formylmethanofuran dehydrogenase subunit B [Methanothrix sp.]
MAICTGCSLLCEDIEATIKDGNITAVKNLCRKGNGHYQALKTDRTKPMIDGKEVALDAAVSKAVEILKNSKNPLLCGWSNMTMEAQAAGILLARKLGATICDTSPTCQEDLMERIMDGKIPTCTLDDVRNFADTSVFWGSDPSNSHPRHLSRFSYYPRGEKRQKSYEEERICVTVDVRKSATATLCSNYYFRQPPGGDAEFAEAVLAVLDGKIPKVGDKKRMIELGTLLRKTEYGVIFPGPGMLLALQGKMDLFEKLVAKLNEITKFKVLPMPEHCNTRGYYQLMREQTGFINGVSLRGGAPAHGPEQRLAAAAKSCDAVLAVGSDPLAELPLATARALTRANVPLIAIDPHRSLTTDAAKVVIPSAMSGLEAGGTALRMDGVKIAFEPLIKPGKPDLLSDEQILARIMEAI